MPELLQPDTRPSEAGLLADYLLADSPVRVVTIGQYTPDISWPADGSRQVPRMHVLSLADCADLIAADDSASPDTAKSANELEDETSVENPGGSLSGKPDYSAIVAVLALDDENGEVEQVLGRAVRLFPHRLVVHTGSAEVADTVFYAFGFRRLSVLCTEETEVLRWFEYRLHDYKQSPDWLNARFWANPERFEVDEEPDIYCDDDEEE